MAKVSNAKLKKVEKAKDAGKQDKDNMGFNNQPKFPKKHFASKGKVSKMKKGY